MDGRLVAACAGTLLAGILAVGAGVLDQARRPLWLDEVVTRLEVTSPRGVFHALLSGVDFSPPVYATLAKWSVELTGAAWPAAVRAPSMLAAALTIFLFGATLRTRHSLPSALAGVLALAAHPLFLAQAFEARPYALWILGCLLTAAALRDGLTARSTRLALSSAFLCSVHYFGMLALGSMVVGAALHAFVVRRLTFAETRRQLMPLAAVGVVLLALLPLAKVQLAVTGGQSWVAPPTVADISFLLRFAWMWRPAAALIVAGALAWLVARTASRAGRMRGHRPSTLDATEWALLSMALIPPGLVIVSVLYKPVMVLRYSAPVVLAVATLCAIAVERLPRAARWLAVVWLVRATLFTFSSAGRQAREESAQLAAEMRIVQRLARDGIATFSPIRHDAYRLSLPLAPAPAVAWLTVADEPAASAAALAAVGLSPPMLSVERSWGLATQREFGFPSVWTERDLQARRRVAIMRDPRLAAVDTVWMPGFRYRCAVTARIAVYDAQMTPAPAEDAAAPTPCERAAEARP